MKITRHSDNHATWESDDGRRFGSFTGSKRELDKFIAEEGTNSGDGALQANQGAAGLPLPTFAPAAIGPQAAYGGYLGTPALDTAPPAHNGAVAHQGGDVLPLPRWDAGPTTNTRAGEGLPLPRWDD